MIRNALLALSALALGACSLVNATAEFVDIDGGEVAVDAGSDAGRLARDSGADSGLDGGRLDAGRADPGERDGCVPGPEVCNGVDDDCEGDVDEGTPSDLGCEWRCAGAAGCDDPVELAAGYDSNCVRTGAGSAVCWGENQYGQVGIGVPATAPVGLPAPVVSTTGSGALWMVSQIASGWFHVCARLESGEVVCWGRNESGQVGSGSALDRRVVPEVVVLAVGGLPLMRVEEVAAGAAHSCARTSSGAIYCWGSNSDGQLGDANMGTDASRARQVRDIDGVGNLMGATQIAADANTTCARLADGRAVCWGQTPGRDVDLPSLVPGVGGAGTLAGVEQVAVGTRFACAVLVSEEVVCWGENDDGQLGDGTTGATRGAPERVIALTGGGPLSSVSLVSAGLSHACASTSTFTACWGDGFTGALGGGIGGPTASSPRPIEVVDSTGAGILGPSSEIGAGGGTTCAVAVGRLYCWGAGAQGEIGDGAFVNRPLPTEVLPP